MFRKLLVPLDHSAFAEQALAPATAIARKLDTGIDVVLVHEQPSLAKLRRSNWNEEQVAEENRYVEHIAERLGAHGVGARSHAVLQGDVVDAIVERVESENVGMIVMTSHGQTGFSRAHLGSVAYALVRRASVPVLILRDAEIAKPTQLAASIFKKILVPLDGSENSSSVVATALELARQMDAKLVLLRVVEPVPLYPSVEYGALPLASGLLPFASDIIQDTDATTHLCQAAREDMAALKSSLCTEHQLDIETCVLVGTPIAAAIVDYATAINADLIAMATHGRGASRWFLGSVADGVLRTSNFPLLLSRSKPRESTVTINTKRAS